MPTNEEGNDNKVVGQTEPKGAKIFKLVPREDQSAAPGADAPATARSFDESAIELMENILQRFKNGDLVGFAMIVGLADEQGKPIDVETWVSDSGFDHDLMFMGATRILQDHLASSRDMSALEID